MWSPFRSSPEMHCEVMTKSIIQSLNANTSWRSFCFAVEWRPVGDLHGRSTPPPTPIRPVHWRKDTASLNKHLSSIGGVAVLTWMFNYWRNRLYEFVVFHIVTEVVCVLLEHAIISEICGNSSEILLDPGWRLDQFTTQSRALNALRNHIFVFIRLRIH